MKKKITNYSPKVNLRVQKLFLCEHPFLGKANGSSFSAEAAYETGKAGPIRAES